MSLSTKPEHDACMVSPRSGTWLGALGNHKKRVSSKETSCGFPVSIRQDLINFGDLEKPRNDQYSDPKRAFCFISSSVALMMALITSRLASVWKQTCLLTTGRQDALKLKSSGSPIFAVTPEHVNMCPGMATARRTRLRSCTHCDPIIFQTTHTSHPSHRNYKQILA